MRLRTLGAVCATSAVAAPIPAYVQTASAQAPAAAPAAAAPPAQPDPGALPAQPDPAPAPGQPVGALPAPAAAPAAVLTVTAPVLTVTPPGDLRKGAMTILTDRHVHFARRYSRLLGDPLTRTERRDMRAQLGQLTPYKVRVETRELREDIRRLRGKLERKQRQLAARAPAMAIPPQLAGIAQCESHSNPRAISSSGTYRGKYQFSFATWAAVGGRGDPAAASETEQDRRAAILYRKAGPGQWPVCGR